MFWDASQAYQNNRYDKATKSFLGSTCGTTFNYPACDAPAWSASGQYPAGSRVRDWQTNPCELPKELTWCPQVSYQGYVWQAKWYASGAPSNDASGTWVPGMFMQLASILAI
jgi:chitinase